MSDLPPGWAWSTVGEVGRIQLGRQRAPIHHNGPNMRPYLRVANVFEDRIDVRNVMEMNFEPDEYERYKLHHGDVLLNEGQTPELLGRPAVYRGVPEGACFTNSLIRFQAADGIDPRWALAVFRHYMHSGRFRHESRITTNIAHLSAGRLKTVEFPVPPPAEQRRIVDVLEDHLSRLEAAIASLWSCVLRLARLRAGVLSHETAASRGQGWPLRPLAELVDGIEAGRSFSCEQRPARDDEWGVIKVSAMTWGEFRPHENKAVSAGRNVDSRHEIRPGDVLVSRANTEAYVGAPVLVRGTRPRLLLSDKSLRLKVADGVDREWLLAVLASPEVRRRISARATGTKDSMRNISQQALLQVKVPVAPTDAQREIVQRIHLVFSGIDRLAGQVHRSMGSAKSLRRSLLEAAFSGMLVAQDPNDESAERLLRRIREERDTIPRNRRTRRPRGTT
jgi:type I restriction enzyme S subunit